MADRNDSPGGSLETFESRGDAVTVRRTVLFVCRHGAAKSVLAAADFRTLAAERGLEIEAVAAGLEPDAQVAPVLIEAVPRLGLSRYTPRAVTSADLASATRVITFSLAPDELLISSSSVERWDDVPSVSENLKAARDAIRRHLDRLIEEYSSPAAG
jgi:arsenate reductase